MGAGFLLDEHLCLLPDGQLLGYALNRSSHMQLEYYYHCLFSPTGEVLAQLPMQLAPPTLDDLLKDLPPALRPAYQDHPLFAGGLPPRIPYLVLPAAAAPRLLWAYLWNSPEYRLRLLDTHSWKILSEITLEGWVPQAVDPSGTRLLCSAYPRHQQLAMFELVGDRAEPRWRREQAGEPLHLAAALTDSWLVATKRQRSCFLQTLDSAGEPVAEVKLKARPTSLAVSGQHWAAGLNNGHLQTPAGVTPLFKAPLELSFSGDGAWIIARGSFDHQMKAIHTTSGQILELPELAGRQDDLPDGNFILRKPGFASDGHKLWTLLGGALSVQPLQA